MKLLSWLFHPVSRRELERILRLENDDIRHIGELVDLLDRARDAGMRAQIEQALIRDLPRLAEQDAGLLDASQRHILNRTLEGRNTELTIAILMALEKIGDESALPYVRRILDSSRDTEEGRRLMYAAQECHLYICVRADADCKRHSLLRPSHYIEEKSGAELLRPSFVPCVPETARRYSERDVATGA